MKDSLEEIKNKIDIVEFIGSYITLKRAGRNFKAVCPFHQEKTPSFVVSPERGIWHCFGACSEGGDIFKFLMKLENITFIEAVRELAQKAGVQLKDISFDDKLGQKKDQLIELNTLAAEFFHYVLFEKEVGKKALDYLKGRKIDKRLAKKFQLGYAPSSWDSLLKFLTKRKYTDTQIYDAGLAVRGKQGGLYDRFRGRIIFPIRDHRGNVIGFSGRILEADTEAKYVNTPETILYHKRETLYGLDLAREAVKREQNVYLVEGEFDVISCFAIGIENVAAIKGSGVTREQLALVKRYTPSVTLMLDSDRAGEEAAIRATAEAEKLDLEIKVVVLSGVKDPDEAIQTDLVAFKKALKEAAPVYDFLIDSYTRKYPASDPYNKKKIADQVAPYIGRIENPVVRSHYFKKLAAVLNVGESSLEELVRAQKQRSKQIGLGMSGPQKEKESRELQIQKYLLSLIFQSKHSYELADKIFDVVSPSDFFVPAVSKLSKNYVEYEKAHPKSFIVSNFAASLDSALVAVFDELYLYASLDTEFEDESLRKLAFEVKKYSLKKKISSELTSDSMSEAQQSRLKELSSRLKEVENKLASL